MPLASVSKRHGTTVNTMVNYSRQTSPQIRCSDDHDHLSQCLVFRPRRLPPDIAIAPLFGPIVEADVSLPDPDVSRCDLQMLGRMHAYRLGHPFTEK